LDSVADSGTGDSINFPVEFLNSLTPSGLPPHKLRLRIGAVVIVLRNLDKDKGICNGCRCLVLKISRRLLDVRILTGRSAGKRYLLPRIPFRSGSAEFPFILRRRQFPVRLAWAMSIHKAQGQTLKQCGVLLPEPVFTHGQLYVCASRSSSALGLRLWLGHPIDGHGYHYDAGTGEAKPHTLNVIFPAVLSMITGVDASAAGCAPPPSSTTSQGAGEAADSAEYVDLTGQQQHSLHTALHKAYATAPVESGAVDEVLAAAADAAAAAFAAMPLDFDRRAELLGLSRSVWAEISQRPRDAIEEFLQAAQRSRDAGTSSAA
jgi:hypothetical protein